MQIVQILEAALDPRVQQIAQRVAWAIKGRLSVSAVTIVMAIAALAWVIAGVRLRGGALMLWLIVPALAFAAAVCVAGPGRLFRKQGLEGPVVIEIARKDAVTLLDVVGLGFAATAILIAIAVVRWRVRNSSRQLT